MGGLSIKFPAMNEGTDVKSFFTWFNRQNSISLILTILALTSTTFTNIADSYSFTDKNFITVWHTWGQSKVGLVHFIGSINFHRF